MSDQWYVARRGPNGCKRYGPVPLAELRGMMDAGRVRPGDLVWRGGMANWQRADLCDDLSPPARRGGPRDDLPYDDRRGYGYDRGPRGYGPDDDRPYRPYYRPRYSRPSSAAWAVPLAVTGGILFCFLACGGAGVFATLMSRPSYAPPVYPTPYGTQTPAGWEEKQDDAPAFQDPNAWQPPPPAFVPPDPNPPVFVPPDQPVIIDPPPPPPVFIPPPNPPVFVPPPPP